VQAGAELLTLVPQGRFRVMLRVDEADMPLVAVGQIGAFEASLMNTPMVNPEQPVEILRTLHSFDPCLACSTHVMSEDGAELTRVKVR
jgi:coenzyme F420-reducing hydrogenase alpha subunit